MELKQPFSLPDIRKYPREVLITLLIGLVFYFIQRADVTIQENSRLNARIDTINTERLRLYDRVIFQDRIIEKQKNEKTATDSLIRQETQSQVEKLLK